MKMFKPGDKVIFSGLKTTTIDLESKSGILILDDSSTTQKGVMRIKADSQRMYFLPDGTIYCHPEFGKRLKRYRKSKADV